MPFDQLEAEIALLLNSMNSKPSDLHELRQQLDLRLGQMRASGMPLPEDLVELEQILDSKFDEDHKRALAVSALSRARFKRDEKVVDIKRK